MLLDNSPGKTVFEWLKKYSETGEMDIVTGYFTIGALFWLSENFNGKIDKFRFVWGGISGDANDKIVRIDLLNQDIGIKKVFELKKIANNAVNFLKQNKVEVKTSEPNFCHAKMFLLKTADDRHKFYLTGSSNLTESGIGQRHTSNVELNIGNTGNNNEYKELADWFNGLWNNNEKVHNAKQKFIDEISKIFKEYTPSDIYFKIISELLPEEFLQEKIEQKLGNSEIYRTLFDFQKKAVVSLIRMLENKNGAILADAVGLGKTFTALAVIKYYQKQGRETVVLAPKKLEYNWEQYKKTNSSILEKDDFDYLVKFHTDLNEDRLNDKLKFLTNEKPKFFVIDESHNLRNDKGNRYKFLLEHILQKNSDAKVLMLSATPINNSLLDVRNQFKLIGNFENIDSLFKRAQEELNKWAKEENPVIGNLVNKLHPDFLGLTDSLVLARTREMVANAEISFPKLEKPINIFETPNCVETAKTFEELMNLLPIRFSAYMPAYYAGLTDKQIIHDESQRAFFLVRMMHVLLVKRLESSWVSFKITLENILEYHKYVLSKLENYNLEKSDEIENENFEKLLLGDDSPEFEELTLGKKQRIKISEIKNLDIYKKDLSEDIGKLQNLLKELEKFIPAKDTKIKRLIDIIKNKQKSNNQKVLIFTTYSDTAKYLFDELKKHFAEIECVTGNSSNKEIDIILKKFCPVSKNANENQIANPVNILISTDILSEGQNLQDCDFVVNYDIHWNPVRVIQRLGRIDRIGSKNKSIYCVNFWPGKNIDEYLNLQGRIEKRMAAMTIAGSEIPKDFTENIGEINRSNELEKKQIEKNLRIMQNNLEEIEPENFGLNNLSLETFRQDLTKESAEKYKNLPNGIFSGFKSGQKGLIALLGHRKDKEQKLIFVDEYGKEILLNQNEILQFLRNNKDISRYVPQPVEDCDKQEIEKYSTALNKWFESQIPQMTKDITRDIFAGKLSPRNMQECVEERYATDNWNLICWEVISDES
jgi:superfamily II DNA or RNA helicase